MMNTNSFAAGVHKRLKRKSTQGVMRRPTRVQVQVYILLMHHALNCARQTSHGIYPAVFVGPWTNYNIVFCEAELASLRSMGYDTITDVQATLDELLAGCDGDNADVFNILQAIVYEFLPVWSANTGYQAQGGARLPVYTYQEDYYDSTRYLVNEALAKSSATVTDILYPIPLQAWLHGKWLRFDTFPRHFDRGLGVVESMR